MNDDDPSDVVHEAFAAQLFGDTPLGRPILGTTESINRITREQITEHYTARYRPENLVVAVAGNVDHDAIVTLVQHAFGSVLGDADPGAATAFRAGRPVGRAGCPAGVAAHRAGQRRAGHRRARPHRRPALRSRRAECRARRRHVVAAVPGGQGEARPCLLGLQLRLAAGGQRHVRRLRGLSARQDGRSARDLPRRDREGAFRRAHQGQKSNAARGRCAGRPYSGWRIPRHG